MVFVVELERSFHKKGWPASFDLEGEDGKTLKIYWERLNRSLLKGLVENKELVGELRDMGFKMLDASNGKESWKVDLGN